MHYKLCRVLSINFLIFLCWFVSGCSDNQFTGTYMANDQTQEFAFLSIVDVNHQITGTLTTIKPGLHGNIESSTDTVAGIADGNSISLIINQFIGKTTLTGKKLSGKITLNYPTQNGQIAKVVFQTATEEEFNAAVNQLKQNLVANYEAKAKLKQAIEEEQGRLLMLSRKLADNVKAMQETGIGNDLSQLESSLSDQYKEYNILLSNLHHLKSDANIHPMTCYQAEQVVSYDFEQEMGYTYQQGLGYAISQFDNAVKSLKMRLANGKSIMADAQANAIQLKSAMDAHQFQLPVLPIKPGEEIAVLDKYQSLSNVATKALEDRIKDSQSLLEKAKALMQEGNSVKKHARSLVRCE